MTREGRLVPLLQLAALPVIVIVAVLVAWKLGYFELDRRRQFVDTVQRLRMLPRFEAAFLVAYAFALILCLPMAIMTTLGGAVFGMWVGAMLSWGGAMLATVTVHQLARSVARKPLQRLFGEHRLLKQLRDKDSVRALFHLRLIPVGPFAVMDYVAGLADVSLRRLLLATALGIIPSVIAYAYVGREILRGLVSRDEASRGAFWIAGGVTVVMLAVSVVPALIRRIRGPSEP